MSFAPSIPPATDAVKKSDIDFHAEWCREEKGVLRQLAVQRRETKSKKLGVILIKLILQPFHHLKGSK
ncbi:hypothetical protein AAFF_G00119950 [Aldrovandia affinis]|uniref:Uncharacterized protein n=1 Tax=Aldrovandia affinis TaxID=143900 RepID=A0AAD7WA18_9TELE|nr:hypothetical protein AAFF_G00119950 [Aldrovandia affinis]